jgi:hypothetical protein
MSPIDFDLLLQSFRPDRRAFMRALVLGTAYATPVLASFSMDGLVRAAAAGPAGSNLCSNIAVSNTANLVVTQTADTDTAVVGELVTYTVRVANCSLQPAPDASFFWQAVGIVEDADQISGSPTYSLSVFNNTQFCGVQGSAPSDLAPLAEVVFSIVVRVRR